MTWPKIVILTFYGLSTLLTIARIGKPAKPMEPSTAAFSVILVGVLAWLVVIA